MFDQSRAASVAAALILLPLPALGLEFESCRLGEGGARVSAQCATLAVPEVHEPAAHDDPAEARRLELPVALIKATSRDPKPDPLVLLAGGPGQASTEAFLPLLPALRRLRAERDLIMLDQRGTGESSLLTCSAFDDEERSERAQSNPELMKQLAGECVAEIAGKANMRFYATRDAARDLEALRVELGLEQLNLYGVSYGTRLAQVYATMYPERVRTLILDGVVPLDLAFGPAIGVDAQAALDHILANCDRAPDCKRQFPNLGERLVSGLSALEEKPRTVRVADPRTGVFDEVEITREIAAQVLRLMTYAPETASLLPMMVDALGRGELDSIAGQWQIIGGGLAQSMNQALSLAVICAEDVPYFDPAILEATASSFLRDDVPKALIATCPLWPSRPLPEGARKPFTSEIPTLLLSGENDPVTPPTYGERVAAGLTHARHLIAPGMGHNVLPRGCVAKLAKVFVETADPTTLDASCLDDLSAPAPFLSPAGPAPPPTAGGASNASTKEPTS